MNEINPVSKDILHDNSNENKKPKILFMTSVPFYEWRGSPIRVGVDIQALAELGFEVDLLTIPIGFSREIPGVIIHRVKNPFNFKNIAIGPSLKKVFFDILIFCKAILMIRKNKYLIIHGVEEVSFLALIIARISGAKAIFEKHSDSNSYKCKNLIMNFILYLYRIFENYTLKRVDATIGTGLEIVRQIKEVAPNQNCHHIFDISSSFIEANPIKSKKISDSFRKDKDDIIMMYIGSFAIYQGINIMFESLPYAFNSNSRLRLIIVGGTKKEIEDKEKWLIEKGIRDKVTFLGFISPDNLVDYLPAADFFLSPRSLGVNTPLKLLDYLKAGKAILATDNLANRRILNDKTALIVNPDNESFAKGMIELSINKEKRESLGIEGKKLIDEIYNLNEFKKLLKICYDGLLTR